MLNDCSPSKNFSCWVKVDYATLLQNIQRHAPRAPLIDPGVPFLQAIWCHLEDDLIRAGISGVLSSDPHLLCRVSPSLQRYLKPGFKPGATGYAREGIIPILGSFADCLNLSNMAQMLDRRLPFLLRVRSTDNEFAGGDWGIASICQRLAHVPMLDLEGFYLHDCPQAGQLGMLRSLLQNMSGNARMLLPLAVARQNAREFRCFSLWENLALDGGDDGCLPFEMGFWAFPVRSGPDYQIYQADFGRLNGLRQELPAQIAGREARIVEAWPDRCELVISGHFAGPFPTAGYLTGGASHNPMDLRNWARDDLQTIVGSLTNCPVYLQKNGTILEILPESAN